MADIIIIAVLAAAVFLILRSWLYKVRSGQCTGGCPGCGGSCHAGGLHCSSGCSGGSSGGCIGAHTERAK